MSTTRTRQLDQQPIVCDRCRHVCSLATVHVPDPGVVPEDPEDMWVEESQELLREGNFACLECCVQYVLPLTTELRLCLVEVRTMDELQAVKRRVERKLRMSQCS